MIFEALPSSLLNHLLAQSDWASSRLRPHSGKVLSIICGPWRQCLAITKDGLFTSASRVAEDDVTITLPGDAPVRLLFDQQSVFADATLQGAADFTETLAFVFRHLRWDAEADLARLTGDIPAYRLTRLARDFLDWHSQSLGRVTDNVSEYLLEEERLFALQRDLALLTKAHQVCAAELAQLEARIKRLGAS